METLRVLNMFELILPRSVINLLESLWAPFFASYLGWQTHAMSIVNRLPNEILKSFVTEMSNGNWKIPWGYLETNSPYCNEHFYCYTHGNNLTLKYLAIVWCCQCWPLRHYQIIIAFVRRWLKAVSALPYYPQSISDWIHLHYVAMLTKLMKTYTNKIRHSITNAIYFMTKFA